MQKETEEQRIIGYLKMLMEGKYFLVDDLDALTVTDLKEDTPIRDIDSSVLENTLNSFRKRYKSEIFTDIEE